MIKMNKRTGIFAVIGNYKKLGYKEFMRRWKEGMMRIPPEDLLFSELIGYVGSIAATIFCIVIFFLWKNMWPIALMMIFTAWIQVSQALGKWQQYATIKSMKSQLIDINTIFQEGVANEEKK
jgi:hypothetical protein